jgi:UDP-galactopyranose mutase
MKYDLVIGGAGMAGATLAHYARSKGKRVLVIERNEIGGHCAGDKWSKYGIHIFHTSNRWLWEYVNNITHFKPVHYSPLAQYYEELYSFPVNLLTLHQLGISSLPLKEKGDNFQELAINLMGWQIYEKFFYHYTKKMWGREPSELPVSILKRIPIRMDYRTSYYDDTYTGVPEAGYDTFFNVMLEGVEIRYGDFIEDYKMFDCKKVFTGSIDEFFNYEHGELEYRGMEFKRCNPQKALAINYVDYRSEVRTIDYSYLWDTDVAIKETPSVEGKYYPVPWGKDLYDKYRDIQTDVVFAGRLGTYKYLNMDQVIERSIELYHNTFTC